MSRSILFQILILLGLFASCKKEETNINEYASLKVVNVIAGGKTTLLNSYLVGAVNNASSNYSIQPGNITLYLWPYGDSLNPYYVSDKIILEKRKNYTLFLAGLPGAVDAILLNEEFNYQTDSVASIRFANLSPDAPAVYVSLSSSASVKEFEGVSYKGITEFKRFPATSANTNYTFQVRNASTNAVLASLTMSGTSLTSFIPRFRYTTLVFRGKISGSPALGISRIDHY